MTTDPRRIPGAIIGPGGPHDRGAVILDTRHAVLLETVHVSTIDPEQSHGASGIALQLAGRINRTQDQANVLYLFGTDGAAAIITELLGLLGRATGRDASALLNDITNRMAKLHEDGNLT